MTAMFDMANATIADGAIPKQYKELMAVAVALTAPCPYCIEVHRKAVEAAEAIREELAEATFVAAALRAGAAVTHGSHLSTSERATYRTFLVTYGASP